MNSDAIRKNCMKCGHRCLMLMKGGDLQTDYCDHAQMECSKIAYCHESIRIPKTKQVRHKKAVEG